jgi:integrative and conjugative element protein (TIGR02256 family)
MDKLLCWVDKEAAKGMFSEACRKDPHETGGCLMGYWTKSGEVVVCYQVGPGPSAIHGRYSFEPDYKFHSKQVGDIYDATDGRITYLGDWHTHPGGSPVPSPLDLKTLKALAASKAARAPKPLMIILGGYGSYSHKGAYVLLSGRPVSCEVVDFDYVDQAEAGGFRLEPKGVCNA